MASQIDCDQARERRKRPYALVRHFETVAQAEPGEPGEAGELPQSVVFQILAPVLLKYSQWLSTIVRCLPDSGTRFVEIQPVAQYSRVALQQTVDI